MKKERILAFTRARELSQAEIENISAAQWSAGITPNITYSPIGGWDPSVDFSSDW